MASSTYTFPSGHPVSQTVEALSADLGSVSHLPVFGMHPEELARSLAFAARVVAQAQELELRLMAAAEAADLASVVGATSMANWFAVETRTTRRTAHRLASTAAALERSCPATREALAGGMLVLEQADVIADAVEALPDDLDPELVSRVEKHLVALGEHHDAKELRVLGQRALEVIAPDIAEAHQQKILDKEERDAAAAARFTLSYDGHGKAHGRFTVSEAQGVMLDKYLKAIAAPKANTGSADGTADGDAGEAPVRRPGPERMGRAFAEWIERYPAERLPYAGGVGATVVVTMTLADLLGQSNSAGAGTATGSGTATMDTGTTMTAAQARRFACEAGIIPIVLGSKSQVLDLGRKTRFHTEPQRVAIATRDKTCTATGCDTPPGMCHVHHDTPWSTGGGTSVKNGRLLCPKHHRTAHDPTYETTKHPTGKISFHRRTKKCARPRFCAAGLQSFSPGFDSVVAGAPSCSTNDGVS